MSLISKQRPSSTARHIPSNHHPNREKWTQRPNQTSVRQALDARELIKVTLLQNTDENIHEVAEILEEEIGVDTVQKKIGRILILYKQSSKKEIARFPKKSQRNLNTYSKQLFLQRIKGRRAYGNRLLTPLPR